ncbi:MAG: methyltransferase domain-containing protein, partial [Myxococcota bacterium]
TWKYDRPHRRLRVVADLVVGEATGGRVLDLGSSTGLLGRMIGPRFDYTGLDVAPSVARAEPGFRIRTAGLDGDWPLDRDPTGAVAPFDVVLASGALEYVADLPATLRRIRSVLRPAGLAVVTLFNLAHVSRGPGATRHPTWRFDARPDEFVLYLREAGLPPVRLVASSAGRGAAPAVDAEVPTDLDRSGAVQTPVPALFQLAHHLVAVCRAGAPKPGPARVEELFVAGEVVQALRLAVATVKDAPWSARAWSDLGVVWLAAGDVNQAHAALTRAKDLDPSRPGLDDDLAAVASRLDPARAATGG